MPPVTPVGMHLADRLGDDYRVIGTTTGTGHTLTTGADFYAGKILSELELPQPGSLDALMAASHNGPFATDLRQLSPADTTTVRAVTHQRYGTFNADLNPWPPRAPAFDLLSAVSGFALGGPSSGPG